VLEQVLAYFVANIFPVVNFLLLVAILISYQHVRAELDIRTRRFERIEDALDRLSRKLQVETTRNDTIEETARIAYARADVADQRADVAEQRGGNGQS